MSESPSGHLLAICAGILLLFAGWLGCYFVGQTHFTAGARYRSVSEEWQVHLYAPLAAAESRYAGYPVCLYHPGKRFLPKVYF
jgi:hypothetical protein